MTRNEITRELVECTAVLAQNAGYTMNTTASAYQLREVCDRLAVVASATDRLEADAELAKARALVAKADGLAVDGVAAK